MEKVTERVLFRCNGNLVVWKVERIYGIYESEMPLELKIITRLRHFVVASIVVKPM